MSVLRVPLRLTAAASMALLLASCGPAANQGCDTYDVSGVCSDNGAPVGPPLQYVVCADDDSEAVSAGTAIIQYRNNCTPWNVGAILRTPDFCTLGQSACKVENKQSALLAAQPPDANFDGTIDPTLSWFAFANLDDGDEAVVNVRGRVSITGGNCAQCPIQVNYASLEAAKSFTLSGKQVTQAKALNHGIWSGYKHLDNSFSVDAPAYLSVGGVLDGAYASVKAEAQDHVKGQFVLATRSKASGKVSTNGLLIDGSFVQEDILVKMHIHSWMSDCRPQLAATASCRLGIDYEPLGIQLSVKGTMLGNTNQKDLCNAYATSTFATVCGSDEFQHACFQGSEQSSGMLSYRWVDANGKALGSSPLEKLAGCPTFPVSVSVVNEWGHAASVSLAEPLDLGKCAALCKPALSLVDFVGFPFYDVALFNAAECKEEPARRRHSEACREFEAALAREVTRHRELRVPRTQPRPTPGPG